MFLSEGYVNNNEEIGADPIYAMQIMQEATDDWNDICMKMIKLEHTAIMREDAELLAEGAKEALTRFKNNIVVLGRKLIEYLERVRVQWSKLQANIATKFVNQDAVNILKSKLRTATADDKRGMYVRIPSNWGEITTAVHQMANASNQICKILCNADDGVTGVAATNMGSAKEMYGKNVKSTKGFTDTDDDLDVKVKKILEGFHFEEFVNEKDTNITANHITVALNFLKERPVAIKNIEIMKKAVTQVQNACIHEMDKEDKVSGRNKLVVLQRAFNQMIIKINKATSIAVKICNTVKGDKKATGISDKERRQAYEDARKMGKGSYGIKSESSVLDLF